MTYKLIDWLSDRNKTDKIDSFKLAEVGSMLLNICIKIMEVN